MYFVLLLVIFFSVSSARIAPSELCYADPKETINEPIQSSLKQNLNLIPRTNNGYTEYSKGCELHLLEPYVNISLRSKEKVNASIGWSFDFDKCQVPLIYREYYNCTGNLIPSPETCDGYSVTLIKFESVSAYALANISLLIQPGIFDSGRYLYSFIFGDNTFNGRIELRVDNETDYPCFMRHGLTIRREDKIDVPYKPSTDSNHKRYRGCFPDSNDYKWSNISDSSFGSYYYEEVYEEDEEYEEENEKLPSEDCRTSNLFDVKESFNVAIGSQSLLIASLGRAIFDKPWSFKVNESYELFRNLSDLVRLEEGESNITKLDILFSTPSPKSQEFTQIYNDTILEDEGIISNPLTQLLNDYDRYDIYKFIGFGVIFILFVIIILIVLCVKICILKSRIRTVKYTQLPKYNIYDI
ncbi:glycoprotein G [Phocid alphaherpesvirus 1]|uniref:Glycoprotein G n=1 Tax=Phocid alphaherpesvirus 1 TaxID=47418 RepID=A0A482F3T6_9ALPH|nr:glycoprotein G [Phocid alphaherpesvirus 1]QBN85183.1 glycoprotein G [Phocid alphaherpesvirus 1]UNP64297.1 glycoprotein G [Phocid alphaherpesvirus 1]